MTSFSVCLRSLMLVLSVVAAGQDAPVPVPQQPTASNYAPAIFDNPIPPDQLTFLKQFAGAPTKDLMHDKQFRKLLKNVVMSCDFHYGRDMSLSNALDELLEDSKVPVQLRDGRFLLLSGVQGPYLNGKAFLWFDLQQGIGLGGFYFQPTNGEPTPALNVFSGQVKESYLSLSQLPQDFAQDLAHWSLVSGLSPVTTRYFLNGLKKKILLEHDENYCLSWDGTTLPPQSGCQETTAMAADLDLTAAYYLDATHHKTDATAWTISGEQVTFLEVRNSRCGIGPDLLGCRIRLTREHIGVITRRGPSPAPPRPPVRR